MLEDSGGHDLIVRLARHVARFRLHDVEIDVLKLLYEALIDREERHGLGEYYTPDWLAAKMVREAVDQPLSQRVLDPACGSGTFLFHAVRHHLAAAAKAGTIPKARAETACALIAGLDVHPVAVIIARVTCLLAVGQSLTERRGGISIPVYVGDAMQLSVASMLAGRELVIRVPGSGNGEEREMLRFPEAVCRDPHLLDTVVDRMRDSSERGHSPETFAAAITALGVGDAERAELTDTFRRYDALRRTDRDSIWAYVARNLSRPPYLSAEERRADVVIGNPPWLAFRHMSDDLQNRFRELARDERIYVGGKLATQADLSSLFFARAVHGPDDAEHLADDHRRQAVGKLRVVVQIEARPHICYTALTRRRWVPVDDGRDPVLSRFRAALGDSYGGRLERVVLYGSRARSDHRSDSDYDVAVFIRDPGPLWEEIHRLAAISTDILLDTGAVISAKPLPAGAYRERTGFMSELRRDGMDL